MASDRTMYSDTTKKYGALLETPYAVNLNRKYRAAANYYNAMRNRPESKGGRSAKERSLDERVDSARDVAYALGKRLYVAAALAEARRKERASRKTPRITQAPIIQNHI